MQCTTTRYRNVQRHREHVNRIRENGSDGMFDVQPTRANFGVVKLGCTYTLTVAIKNIGANAARIRIMPFCQNNLEYSNMLKHNGTPGNIAPGMSAHVTIMLVAQSLGYVDQPLEIVTESLTYRIPVSIEVLGDIDYDIYAHRNAMVGKSDLLPGVERLETAKITKSGIDNGEDDPCCLNGPSAEACVQDVRKYATELGRRTKQKFAALDALLLKDEQVPVLQIAPTNQS